jgi:shikimate dehydrogenase
VRLGASSFVGVLGWPLEHTLSPVMHNAAFRNVGLDWAYFAFPVPPPSLPAAVEGLRVLGAAGANVTMPHKEAVIALLDEISGDARSVGAVNTIRRLGDKLIGHNTDVRGFRDALMGDAGFDPAGKRVLVLGAGGAARAVVRVLATNGAGVIMVAARRPERGEEVAAVARSEVAVISWDDTQALKEAAAGADLIVNSTPLGMKGEDVPMVEIRPHQTVFDLVYIPPTTPLMKRARKAGAEAWGGLGMLVHQAAASFQIWTGQDAPTEIMSAAALRALRSARPE